MRKKEKRLVVLKDPQLRRVRTELRNLLYQAFEDHSLRIFQEMDLIHSDSTLDYEVRRKRVEILYQESEKLRSAYHHSVGGCKVCGRRDLDLVYNPILNKWYCEECYEFNRKGNEELYP